MSTWEQSVPPPRARTARWLIPLIALFVLLIAARTIAAFFIEYEWWKEMDQVETWTRLLLYGYLPVLAATVVVFIVLWIAHARGMKRAGTGLREHRLYGVVSTAALLLLSLIISRGAVDGWTVVRYVASRAASDAGGWRDPVFGNPLRFYIFDLPFWRDLVHLLLVVAAAALLIHWLTTRFWSIRKAIGRGVQTIELDVDLLRDALSGPFARIAAAVLFVAIAVNLYLGRYDLLFSDHGFMVGVDYVDEHVRLPLQVATAAAALAGAVFVLLGRWRWLLLVVAAFLVKAIVPSIVGAVYVRPNELSLQRPYIERHIQATRAAFAFDERLKEVQFPARLDAAVDVAKNQALFENVRLWDWRAFHDTVTQIQALRQYYTFPDADVDRYMLDGQVRQVMIAPRELEVRELGGQQSSWINTHFIYTHGYGLVMASASRITAEGQPVLFIQDAPPKVNTAGLQLTRPELYYGERTHEPVFVRTEQPEFNYPSGAENVHTKYEGRGGIPVGSPLVRLAAAVSRGDWNIMLTGNFTGESRMLIRRNVRERVEALAGFLEWDSDPYLVVTKDGKLMWFIDGYTSSSAHPYSRRLRVEGAGTPNYMRNSVKATIDAYDGTVTLYVFDPGDPIIRAWQAIFPKLFKQAAEMPQDLRAHVRYPEVMFRAQAEIYRTFHMRDPEAFYNKEDLWDLAKENYGQATQAALVQPTFVIATLPGETRPEFLLLISFTPRNKDNMIGVMAARSDGEHLGEIVVLQLSKQALIYGPLQIEARIDSDQVISKDLSLWNQQGSQVLRGQLLVLPIGDTFLYVEPIYLRSAQASMPQLKKVVLAMGNRIIYRDTYEQAIAELAGSAPSAAPETLVSQAGPPGQPPGAAPAPKPGAQTSPADARLQNIRDRLRRYRELAAQGRWSEAGRELEAIEEAVR